MTKIPVYFDGAIALFDVMRAADAIGCTVVRDREQNRLCVVRKTPARPDDTTADVIDLVALPNFLKRQAD